MKDQPSDYLYVILLGIVMLLVGGFFIMANINVSEAFKDKFCDFVVYGIAIVLFIGAPIWATMSSDEEHKRK